MAGPGDKSESEEASPETGDSRAELVGQVISGRYRVIEHMAAGGMSSVYRGEHIHMRKSVAIKVLDPKAERLPELVLRFQREAIAGAHVQHPNIAAATDFGQLDDGSYFLVLEYVPGTTLNKLIAQGPLPLRRAVAIARQIASALAAAHETGIVHRDLKPANVMVVESQDDTVKLIDFGLAQVRMDQVPTLAPPPVGEKERVEQALTAVGVVFGTIAYMAPEAALGMTAVDARSDLYALGITLYEMLSGDHPFDATEPVQLFLQQRTMKPRAMSEVAGIDVPAPIEAIVMRLLEKAPSDRFQTAGEVVGAIDAAMLTVAFGAVEAAPASNRSDAPAPLFGEVSDDARTIARPWGAAVQAAAAEQRASAEPAADQAGPLPSFPLPTLLRGEPALAPAMPGKAATKGGRLGRIVATWRATWKDARAERLAGLARGERQPLWVYGALGGALLLIIALAAAVFFRGSSGEAPVRAESAAPEPSAVAPPAPAAAPAAREIDLGADDTAAARENLLAAARAKDWDKGVAAVLALARMEPGVLLYERDFELAWRAIAVGAAQDLGARADQLFDGLTNDNGADGLDLLYDVARFRPGTKAGKRAREILKRPEILARATPALKLLLDLSQASCSQKRGMFGRVADEGDTRALYELTVLRDAECNRWRDPCCFKDNRALSSAIRSLNSKVQSAPPR